MARRNDAPWRNECVETYGDWCRRCKRTGVQADHMIPRAQQGPSVVENGLMLCRECHDLKTEHKILIERAWLTARQLAWLRTNGHVWWDDNGETYGQHRRLFKEMT